MISDSAAPDGAEAEEHRQHIEKVPGRRRARLTPVAGTDTSPETPEKPARPAPSGPNDRQLLEDIPPHY